MNNLKNYLFTSESVSEGHPDKVCDQISDAVLDAYLKEDPNSRVACETLIKNNLVVIAGEITSEGNPDLESVVRKVINDIGYDNDALGFNGSTCEFINHITQQSPDIAQGVNEGQGEGSRPQPPADRQHDHLRPHPGGVDDSAPDADGRLSSRMRCIRRTQQY